MNAAGFQFARLRAVTLDDGHVAKSSAEKPYALPECNVGCWVFVEEIK